MNLYLYIFIGGGIGSLIRFLISAYISGSVNTFFPLGTFLVNTIGSFFVGVLYELFDTYMISAEIRIFLLIGFLGGFTTFSSLALESTSLLRNAEYKYFFMNILGQNLLSLVLVVCGMICVRSGVKFIGR